MAEYKRTGTHQFCDSDLCMVLDTVTGEPERAFRHSNSVGPLKEALEYVSDRDGGWAWAASGRVIKKNGKIGSYRGERTQLIKEQGEN